ncbi:lanthionine synthetase C family protein [Streptomyces chattanoogensis]|uniref:lanthionine synthetase C family protein n=1 Tax=Streptomyces chattanoogensis TaxID=66876 RepID=UPI0006B4F868|nr:lanthionine synthetase C family protein [Streptomyces chattanoogensis]
MKHTRTVKHTPLQAGNGPSSSADLADTGLDGQVLYAVHAVAERLRTPEDVARRTRQAREQLPAHVPLPPWQPAQLWLGHTGIALLYTRLAHDDSTWARTAHAHLSAALASASEDTIGDLLLSASLHAQAHDGYSRLLQRAAPVHASAVRASLDALTTHLRTKGPGLAYPEYDLLYGLTSAGRRLMTGAAIGSGECAAVLHDVLRFLTSMARPVQAHGSTVPGWWSDPELPLVPEADKAAYPRGDFNLGIAHGICGPLSLLAVAHQAGYRVPHMQDALRAMADWVLSKRLTDERGVHWPGRVAFEEETGRIPPAAMPSRPRTGWCYGTAGVARSLYLAGRALNAPTLTEAAVEAMRSLFRGPYGRTEMPDATFCHGRAGILQAAVRMASDTGDPELWQAAGRLAHELAQDFDPKTAFGYRFPLLPTPGAPGVDEPGLLQGAAGVALALISYADARRGNLPDTCTWDTALLMG